jgi:hypothetical protein
MEFKPSDIYLGVVELFSVLLPGALLEAAIVRAVYPIVHNPFAPLMETGETQWVAFGFAAYALGAFVFPVASLVDETFYNRYREKHWPKPDDHAFQLATELRHRFFQSSRASGDVPMNTFAWAKSMLILKAAAAFADVQRYEAESKFFRSLVVVLPIVGLFLAFAWRGPNLLLPASALILSLLMAGLSFRRYAERRQKSTEWAYRYVITLLQVGDAEAVTGPPPKDKPTARRLGILKRP